MEKFSFFNDVNDDRVYYAEDWARHLKKYFTNGIFNNELNVVANDDMTITIKEGDANIEGYRYTNTGDLVKTIEMADGTLNRIDNVVLRLDLTNRLISAQIIKGTFADKPVAPELVRTSTIYDLRIAKISIPAGTTTITQDLITDTRFITSDCGNVISTVKTPDTENLFIQMQTLFEKQINELNNNFETWFDSMKNQLSSDAAGNLQNQINNLNSNKADNATYDPNSKNLQLTSNGKNVGDSVHIPTGITDEVSGEEDLKIINNKGVVKFLLGGKTEQKNYEGKNVFSLNKLTWEITSASPTLTINNDNSCVISKSNPVEYALVRAEITNFLKIGKTYSASSNFNSNYGQFVFDEYNGSSRVQSSVAKVTIKEGYKYYIKIYLNKTSSAYTGDLSITYTNMQIEEGTTTTSFEPYVGEQASPNPDYPQEIENVRGVENIWFGGESTTNNGITFTKNADGSYDITGTATARADCVNYVNIANTKLKNDINYNLSINKLTNDNVLILTEAYANETWDSHVIGFLNTTTSLLINKIINIKDNITRVRYSIRVEKGQTVNIKGLKIQLEEGSIAHDFVPYGSNYLQLKNTTDNESKTINIDLKGNELCSDKEQMLKDELIVENGIAKIIKKYDEVILDGTEDWNISSNNPNQINTIYFRSNKLDNLFSSTSELTSNYFTYVRYLWDSDIEGIYIDPANAQSLRIRINKTKVSTAAEFKTWLKSQYDSGNPVKVQYQLAEPQTIDLGEVDLDLLEGNSTLNVEEELKPTISVKYYTDDNVVALKKKVENKQNVILHGTTAPSNDLGEDGDIYLQHN